MSDLSGTAKCIKYTLFFFNMLFLLAGLALIIVGSIVQYQTSNNGFSALSGVGIFIIAIGSVVFIIAFFGCAGAINNNYCMVVTFGVLLIILLLAEIAAVVAGFTLRNRLEPIIQEAMNETTKDYFPGSLAADTWNNIQKAQNCCGTYNYTSWEASPFLMFNHSVPDSCCINSVSGCGSGAMARPLTLKEEGCVKKMVGFVQMYMIAAGAVAAGVAAIEILGIIFAFALGDSLRKDYRVV